jgi:iron(III) transport system ATP-binding protein
VIRLNGLSKRYPGKTVTAPAVDGIDLEIADGELVTLLGPSGCGKTTTLRLIAGLERPTAGEIEIDGAVVSAPARGVQVGANRRPIGIVFQSYAIWPHMNVLQNVAFPLRVSRPRVPAAVSRQRALAALDLVGLADFAGRPAPMLSGGQQQRVALARALVREPKVLLLDEPLSNLDKGLRDRMRDEIRIIQQRLGITTVFVTHDQDEALAISDRMVVMDGGRIVENGLPQEIYAWPRTEFAARFLGIANRLGGTVVWTDGKLAEVTLAPGALRCRASQLTVGEAVSVFMRPESFRLSRTQHDAAAWQARVELSIYRGDCWDYTVSIGPDELKVRVYREKVGLSVGDRVYLEPDGDSALVLADRGDTAAGPEAAAERSGSSLA